MSQVISAELLKALAAIVPEEPKRDKHQGASCQRFDIDQWITRHNVPIARALPWGAGGRKFILQRCQWNPDHTNGAAFIVQFSSGAVDAGCHHNGCVGKRWHELRDVVEPGWRSKKPAYSHDSHRDEKHGESEFHLQFFSMKELLSLPPDPARWLWDQVLPAAGVSVLVAKPKVGKSSLAANLTIAVSRGLPFLGRQTQQSPVAYLSLDASLPEILETFQPFGPRETDPIFVHAGSAPREAVLEIMEWVKKNNARFVVVETIQKLFRFENLNDYSEVINTSEPLIEAAREQKIHVAFVHHAKKDAGDDLDSAIGSTAIRGLAYTYLHMKRLPDSERRILRSDQRGGKNIAEVAVGFGKTG
jgi:hypothetical protein